MKKSVILGAKIIGIIFVILFAVNLITVGIIWVTEIGEIGEYKAEFGVTTHFPTFAKQHLNFRYPTLYPMNELNSEGLSPGNLLSEFTSYQTQFLPQLSSLRFFKTK